MSNISAYTFFKAWLETVQSKREHLLSIWRQAKVFTSYVRNDDISIIKEVATRLNLICYPRDYYCIDAILYKEEDLVPKRPEGQYWFRNIRVAFEHENNFSAGLYQEVSHLLVTNSELKVLVTYPNGDTSKELKYLHEIISGSNQSKMLSDDESFLIIFGYENNFVWQALVYKEDDWKVISN